MYRKRKIFSNIVLIMLVFCSMYSTFFKITNINLLDFLNQKTNSYTEEPAVDVTAQNFNNKPKTLEDTIDLQKLAKVNVIATGYTAGEESTGKTPSHPEYGITSSGVTVKRDLYSTIAADLSKFPYGTILYIPDYGFGVVADRGGAIKGNKIDLFFDTVSDVYSQWGKKQLDVYVVEMGSGKVDEETLKSLNENRALQTFRRDLLENKY